MTHLEEEDLILLHYGDSAAPPEARAHLNECPECRLVAESLAQTLGLCGEWSVPEPEPEFGRAVWARLAPRLEQPRRAFLWTPWRLAFGAAVMAALLVAAYIAGYVTRRPQPAIAAGLTDRARERIFEISLADHLDRAGMLLTEISNTGYSGVTEFSVERDRAQDLVSEGRLMRDMLASRGPGATLSFLDEVERFMQEVAHAPDRVDAEQIRAMRERIGTGSLLFKVRIIEANLRAEGQKS